MSSGTGWYSCGSVPTGAILCTIIASLPIWYRMSVKIEKLEITLTLSVVSSFAFFWLREDTKRIPNRIRKCNTVYLILVLCVYIFSYIIDFGLFYLFFVLVI